MCALVFLGVLTIVATAASAGDKSSWQNLQQLPPGQQVTVVKKDSKEIKGAIVAVSADAILLKSRDAEISTLRTDVVRVTRKAKSKRLRNMLIGAGIGVVAGIVADRTLGEYFRNETGLEPGMAAAIWGVPIGLGAGLGAAISDQDTIYRAK